MKRQWPDALTLAVVAAFAAIAAWLMGYLVRDNPILGDHSVQAAFNGIVIVAAGVTVMMLVGRLLIAVMLSDSQPTNFLRAIVYGVLTFAVTALLLAHFGFDLSAILTTSAILTAAVGLAMQPTLSAIIAGIAVHTNGVVRLGDGILHDGEWARVVSLTWRSVVAEKISGARVVIPNNHISDQVAQVIRREQPLRTNSFLLAPAAAPPELISALVSEMVSDFAAVDASQPVVVTPAAVELQFLAIRYRIRYSIMNYFIHSDIEGEVARRSWYVYQRNGISLPIPWYFPLPAQGIWPIGATALEHLVSAALTSGGARELGLADIERSAAAIAAGARLLLYAPDERLVLPEATAGSLYLLVRGQTVRAHEFGLDEEQVGRPVLPAFRLGPDAAVRGVAERLAEDIGPYAEIAVRRAALSARDLAALCRVVALEIDDASRRERFLADVEPPDVLRYGPGLVFHSRRNAAGALTCHLALRAATEVAVLAIPPALLAGCADQHLAAE